MSKNAKFELHLYSEAFLGEDDIVDYDNAQIQTYWQIWQAAIQSLEVTPELVEIGFRATGALSRNDVQDALTAVFDAIKEAA